MTTLWGEGFLLGLSTGTFCLVSCAPLFLPYMLADGRPGFFSNLNLMGQFLLGRLGAYLLFGFGVGFLGERFAAKIPSGAVSVAMILSGLLIIGYVLTRHLRDFGLCRFLPERFFSKPVPLLLGFFVGINLCPPFLAGAVRVFELANPWKGAGYFLAFFAGTSLYLLPILAASPLTRVKRLQSVGVLACVLAGAWFIFQGASGFFLK